jgi:hypothetical protein
MQGCKMGGRVEREVAESAGDVFAIYFVNGVLGGWVIKGKSSVPLVDTRGSEKKLNGRWGVERAAR